MYILWGLQKHTIGPHPEKNYYRDLHNPSYFRTTSKLTWTAQMWTKPSPFCITLLWNMGNVLKFLIVANTICYVDATLLTYRVPSINMQINIIYKNYIFLKHQSFECISWLHPTQTFPSSSSPDIFLDTSFQITPIPSWM